MAKKKVSQKKVQSKPKSSMKKDDKNLLHLEFKGIVEGMTNTQKRTVLQHNLQELYKIQNAISSNVMLDAKDSVISSAVMKLLLIDRKLVLVGSEITRLNGLIELEEKGVFNTDATENKELNQ